MTVQLDQQTQQQQQQHRQRGIKSSAQQPTPPTTTTASNSSNNNNNNNTNGHRRRTFTFFGLSSSWFHFHVVSSRTSCTLSNVHDTIMDYVHTVVEYIIYGMGPLLIILALGIICLLAYTFFCILVPMIIRKHSIMPTSNSINNTMSNYKPYILVIIHSVWVVFVITNILYNYALCVITKHTGSTYNALVREFATCCNFIYPETPAQLVSYRRDYQERIAYRLRQIQIQNNNNNNNNNNNTNHNHNRSCNNGPMDVSSIGKNGGTSTSGSGNIRSTSTAIGTTNTFDQENQQGASISSASPNNNDGTSLFVDTTFVESTTTTTTITHRSTSAATSNNNNNKTNTTTKQPNGSSTSNNNYNYNNPVAAAATIPKQQQQQQQQLVQSSFSNSTTNNNNNNNVNNKPKAKIRTWTLLQPFEWGYCNLTHQPKPPRSHYDNVSKKLILNLDHYCPWMFNAIGYFNYRYFVNFLIYNVIGMFYGACMLFEPFKLIGSPLYKDQLAIQRRLETSFLNQNHHHKQQQPQTNWHPFVLLQHLYHNDSNNATIMTRIRPMMPLRQEKLYVTMSFMLCVAVGMAVLVLGAFHIYLTITAQTTIEFHGNSTKRRNAKLAGLSKWINPYSLGSWRKNWEQVYGKDTGRTVWTIVVSLLPSSRQPDYFPAPVPENPIRPSVVAALQRQQELSQMKQKKKYDTNAIEDNNNNQDDIINVMEVKADPKSFPGGVETV